MKGWPPPESLWKKVAEDLPPGTDMPTLQAKICTVVSVYLNDESGKADIYAEIHKQLRGLEFEQLDRALGSLRALPSAFRPSIVDQVDLQSLYDLRTYSKGQITRHKYNSAKRNSDGREAGDAGDTAVSRAWAAVLQKRPPRLLHPAPDQGIPGRLRSHTRACCGPSPAQSTRG
jgi:hypothetical protein